MKKRPAHNGYRPERTPEARKVLHCITCSDSLLPVRQQPSTGLWKKTMLRQVDLSETFTALPGSGPVLIRPAPLICF